jgi:hypothetical protein
MIPQGWLFFSPPFFWGSRRPCPPSPCLAIPSMYCKTGPLSLIMAPAPSLVFGLHMAESDEEGPFSSVNSH